MKIPLHPQAWLQLKIDIIKRSEDAEHWNSLTLPVWEYSINTMVQSLENSLIVPYSKYYHISLRFHP